MKYSLIPRDFPRAQAIFHRISRLQSQYRHSQLPNNGFSAILGPSYCGIGATIRIGREMLCLPYAGFFFCPSCKEGPSIKLFSPKNSKCDKTHVKIVVTVVTKKLC